MTEIKLCLERKVETKSGKSLDIPFDTSIEGYMDDSHVSMDSLVRKPNLLPSTLCFFGRIFRRDSPLFPLRYSAQSFPGAVSYITLSRGSEGLWSLLLQI
jgi:hypothetical protein